MTPPDELTDDPRVIQLARDYLAELEAGRQPDRRVYLARHPELAHAVEECLDGVELAHAAGQALRPLAEMPEAVTPAEPLGDFRIIREIGRGGMGVVYEAVQLSLGRRVALKVLPFAATLDGKHLQRFKTEAHAAAQLHHTNIVPVYAVGCDRGVHYYAMQLIEGRPLDEIIRERRGEPGPHHTGNTTVDLANASTLVRPTSTPATAGTGTGTNRETYRAVARVMIQVAEALDYAHDCGVVHRDIKPANLLLDARGTVWITDFGLAQVSTDVGLTRTGDIFGTLRYMSPEQAAGRRTEVDHRTDVYSLGATLYELLTLRPLFEGTDRQELLHGILTREPLAPRAIDRAIPVDLETIVLKAVAKLPAERYGTAGELAADLRRFLDERPILARRPSWLDHGRKWLRRHPATVAAALLVLSFGVIVLAISTALVFREQSLTAKALDGERQRSLEAEQRFQLARRSADEMIRIANEDVSDHPSQQALKQRLLGAALAYYQEFIELRASDPSAQAELELTRNRIQSILSDLAVMQGAWQHFLLRIPDVQNDLGLTSAQRFRLLEVFPLENGPEGFRNFHRFKPEERSGKLSELIDEVKANESEIANILTPDQQERLQQIALQLRGATAFREPKIVAALKLTDDQRAQIRALVQKSPGPGDDRGFGRGFDGKGSGPGRRPDFKGGPDVRFRDHLDRILQLLTPEQRAMWQNLSGPPYRGAIPPLRFGFPGMFGPGGPPPGAPPFPPR